MQVRVNVYWRVENSLFGHREASAILLRRAFRVWLRNARHTTLPSSHRRGRRGRLPSFSGKGSKLFSDVSRLVTNKEDGIGVQIPPTTTVVSPRPFLSPFSGEMRAARPSAHGMSCYRAFTLHARPPCPGRPKHSESWTTSHLVPDDHRPRGPAPRSWLPVCRVSPTLTTAMIHRR